MITNYRLKLNKGTQRGQFRLVHLSDLQSNWFGENQKNITDKVKLLEPDLIVITGDIIDRRHTDYNAAEELLKGLVGQCPVCYVNGNHECLLDPEKLASFYDSWKDEVNILLNENRVFDINGLKVKVAGLDEDVVQRARGYERGNKAVDSQLIWQYLEPAFHGSEMADSPRTSEKYSGFDSSIDENGCVNLLLSHEPQLVELYEKSQADVVFSGHAHGGQIRLPFIGGLYAPEQGFLPKYKEGIYNLDANYLVVNRGLGNSRFPFRVFNRPEIVCLDLEVE